MIPKQRDFLTQQRIRLYNNLAKIGEIHGRLEAFLTVFPGPIIEWEFEVLGRHEARLPTPGSANPIPSLQGHEFIISKPYRTGWEADVGPKAAIRGNAQEAVFGSETELAHSFRFLLGNARFQALTVKQETLQGQVVVENTQEMVETQTQGRRATVQLDATWSLTLETQMDALEWLNPSKPHIGTKITTVGTLYQHAFTADQPETYRQLVKISLREAVERLDNLSWLFSFANAGRLGSVYVEGTKFESDGEGGADVVASMVRAYLTTPIEQLGFSWVDTTSDLATYLRCVQTLERMSQTNYWKETLELSLMWYQQGSRSQSWPVVANALGALLETLSYTVLVLDEANPAIRAEHQLLFDFPVSQPGRTHWNLGSGSGQEGSPTQKRTKLLLERIGLTVQRGHNDMGDVNDFLLVRNDATHPTHVGKDPARRNALLLQALMWIDEVLLWRLGYSDVYRDRRALAAVVRTAPRYDLTTRDPSW